MVEFETASLVAKVNHLEKTAQKNHYRKTSGVASLNFNKILDDRRREKVAR